MTINRYLDGTELDREDSETRKRLEAEAEVLKAKVFGKTGAASQESEFAWVAKELKNQKVNKKTKDTL